MEHFCNESSSLCINLLFLVNKGGAVAMAGRDRINKIVIGLAQLGIPKAPWPVHT